MRGLSWEVLLFQHRLTSGMDYILLDGRDNRNDKVWCTLDLDGSGKGPVAGSCNNHNKLSGSIKGGEFFKTLATISISKRLYSI
jgi:hypothetical protein